MDRSLPDPPTAVFLHGILGCRKNWGSFAKRLAREFPMWQFLLVDLRCHGDSASMKKRGPHTVASAALDVLKLVRDLRITPRVLVGHSFGGKVVLSMVDQAAKPLARPVRKCRQVDPKDSVRNVGKGPKTPNTGQTAEKCSEQRSKVQKIHAVACVLAGIVSEGDAIWRDKMHTCGAGADIRGYATWGRSGVEQPLAATEHAVEELFSVVAKITDAWILDATPGKVRAGGDGEDHPAELISLLNTLPKEVSSKKDVVKALIQQGFSNDVAQWVVTNLRPTSSPNSRFSWAFDLKGISEMYQSYEETNLWKIVEDVPRGVHINFLKAERSLHRWALEDLQRIHVAEEVASEEGGGVEMHVLEDAGHWVHTDNPDGLFRILSSSFQGNSRT
ncbi:esterase/lipase [Trifolium pratense]|uniref:Esterase/lipase n=2 Tax=Trifolium pratense TaxID=57577 RepID=A0A2K3PIC5_TRIPR|nr:esterase/lipase [Trifolium pratense]